MSPSFPSQACTRGGFFAVLAAGLLLSACAAPGGATSAYDSRVKYQKGAAISFPDFDLTYLGSRHQASRVFPHGFNYQDFRVSRGATAITVSWSSGTGLIVPRSFSFGGKKYLLHLVHFRSLGRLAGNELVITRE